MATKAEKEKAKIEALQAERETLLARLADLGISTETGTETISKLSGEEDNKTLKKILKAASGSKEEEETSFDVVDKSGKYIRTYSLEVHGEDFKTLAEEFIAKPEYAKRAYSLIPSGEIESVRVLYREKEDFEKKLDDQSPDSPIVDKERSFTDKEAALAFNLSKKGSIVPIRK